MSGLREVDIKLDKLRRLMVLKEIDFIAIEKQCNFSWLTGGRSHIGIATENSCATLLISKEEVYLLSSNIESQRLIDEEVKELMVTPKKYYWFDESSKIKLICDVVDDKKLVYDFELPVEFMELRSELTIHELSKYRDAAQKTARALEKSCREIEQGQAEFEIVGIMIKNAMSMGVEPVVRLCAVDDRVFKYRHPLPTNKRLEKYALLAMCCKGNGLISSCTRLVSFGSVNSDLLRKHDAVTKVDAALIIGTRPDRCLGDVFDEACKVYRQEGFDKEWFFHHQGGLSGYNSREIKAHSGHDYIIKKNQAYAWNPSICGTKSEDTIITGENGNEIITQTGEFPSKDVVYDGKHILRPDILIR